jgi:nucleotide-binding universal stress UspA family protein
MSLIIVATDFSDVGENAVYYACNLAVDQQAELVIIHSFIIPVMFSDIPLPGSLVTDAQNDAEKQMNNLVADVNKSFPGLSVRGTVIYGDTISAVNDFVDENKSPWLVVVGNSRTGDNTWLDSTLLDAIKKLRFPVLAVPANAVYKPAASVCFAFDNKHANNTTALNQLTGIVSKFKTELHVLTVSTGAAAEAIDEDARKMLTAAAPVYHFINGATDVDAAIHDFTVKNNIDWLAMIPRKHSFFEGLFHKSHTKAITHNIHIPIMALHETE